MTYSIIGYDPDALEWGIAVQSKFLSVGSVVPWAKAGVGAIATQSYANTAYGPNGLKLLSQGLSASEVIKRLVDADEDRELRQVGIIDANGQAASFTGKGCYDWAGGITGQHFAAQGNILVDENTVKAMEKTFINTSGTLAERLLDSLEKGQEAGGDSRGMQSASLLIVKHEGGYGGFNDRFIDLRVDDHPYPIQELKRLYSLHRLYFSKPSEDRVARIENDVASDLQTELHRLGYLTGLSPNEEDLQTALTTYIHTENFEMREQESGWIDLDLLAFMKNQKNL